MRNDKLTKNYILGAILRRRHGSLLQWQPPEIFEGVGPSFPNVFNEFNAYVQAAIETSRETMAEATLDELLAAYDHAGFPRTEAAQLRETILDGEESKLRQSEPAWFAGGFNVVGREADYKYWLIMKNWSLYEAVALSIGFEPAGDILEDNLGKGCQSQVVDFYQKRLTLLQDNFDWDEGSPSDKRPSIEVAQWMVKVDLEIPAKLREHVTYLSKTPDKQSNSKSKVRESIDPRERKTMLRLIIGLAKGGYSYDEKAARSSVPKEIANDLDLEGINLEQDTIRKYLREGAELLKNDLSQCPDTQAKKG
ncbi:MAG: hypothetical protein ABJP06_09440 [Sulfitobacter sp.]